jgi:carbon-monoxide dehydrogenase iron sulfur subunit
MKVLVFDPELCDGSRGCEETCAQTLFKEVNRQKSAIRILDVEGKPGHYQANLCTQCGECIDICPAMAIKRDKRGVVRIDKELCVGCLSCVGFCPHLAMFVHPDDTVPFKCIVCGACAKQCPTGALSVQDVPDAELTETEKRLKVGVLPRAEVMVK